MKSPSPTPSPGRDQQPSPFTPNIYPSPSMKSPSVKSPTQKPPKARKNSTISDTANRTKDEQFSYNNLSAKHHQNLSNSRKEWNGGNSQEKKWVNFYQETVTINNEIQIMNM